MAPLTKTSSFGQTVTAHDPLHLIATYDPVGDEPETALHRSLSRTLTRDDEEQSSSKSPNVYVDELNGSDTLGTGTKQAPFQSIYGALSARGENISLYVKRRCIDTQTKYWIPAESGTSVDLQRFRTNDRPAEEAAHKAKIAEAQAAREQLSQDKAAGKTNGSLAQEKSTSTSQGPTTNGTTSDEAPKKKGFLKRLFS